MTPEEIGLSWSAFIRGAIGDRDMTNAEIGDLVGVSESMVGNWINAKPGQPTGSNVIEFARRFGYPLSDALVAAGYGEEREYRETVIVPRDVTDMSADEMIDRIVMMLARIREIVDAAPAVNPSDNRPKRKRRFSVRSDVDPL